MQQDVKRLDFGFLFIISFLIITSLFFMSPVTADGG